MSKGYYEVLSDIVGGLTSHPQTWLVRDESGILNYGVTPNFEGHKKIK